MRPVLLILLLCLLLLGSVPVSGLVPSQQKYTITQVAPSSHITIGPGAVATMVPATTHTAPPSFSIVSDPPGAEIWFNGNKTPFITPLTIGCPDLIFVTLKYPGYQEYTNMTGCWYGQSYTLSAKLVPLTTTSPQSTAAPDQATPQGGNTLVYPLSGTLQAQTQAEIDGSQPSKSPAPGTGSLSVATNPPGANILVDGIPGGASPATIPGLSAGMHNITITKAGYAELITQVNIVGGQTMEYSTTLIPATNPTKPKSPGFEVSVAGLAVACIVLLKRPA